MKLVMIGGKMVGDDYPYFIIAEADFKGSFDITKITNLTKVVRSVRNDP